MIPEFKFPKLGETVTFEMHGKRFHLKKINRTEYFLSCPLSSPRSRFGNRKEILEDIQSISETGVLPRSKNWN